MLLWIRLVWEKLVLGVLKTRSYPDYKSYLQDRKGELQET